MTPSDPETAAREAAVLRRVAWRLLPFLFILYIAAYLDRINVGFAALQMNADLGFSAAVYGFGAGIFFLGYILFEVPSNLILERVGPRLWIARIMVTWGLVSGATALVRDAGDFYLVRFLLGVAEAGFFPGIILYLTYWFPAPVRARVVAGFMTATAVAGIVGGPLSGWLLELHDLAGLRGWQWLFLLEALPSLVLGVVVLFLLTDRPEQAQWLHAEERAFLAGRLAQERRHQEAERCYSLRDALTAGRVWYQGLIYFLLVIGMYGVGFWMPQVVKGFGALDDFTLGLLTAVPYGVAAVGMVLVGRHSDRTGERRGYVALAATVAAAGLVLAALADGRVLVLVGLSLGALGIWGALGPFWALSTGFLTGTAAAGGIALINSVGNLGGFVGPYLVGLLKDVTVGYTAGFLALAALLLLGAGLALGVRRG